MRRGGSTQAPLTVITYSIMSSSIHGNEVSEMSTSSGSIEVRSFGSFEEIRAHRNFRDSNPITKATYRRIVGDYNFADEIHCCLQKENGKLCGELHKKGWVVERNDGTITVVGNMCAHEKFGADSRMISDRSRYLNEKRRLERLSLLAKQLEEKDSRLRRLVELKTSLQTLALGIGDFLSQIGPLTTRRLQDMVRTGQFQVVIGAVKIREEVDAKGKRHSERSVFRQALGSLGGLAVTSPQSFQTIYAAMSDITQAYVAAGELGAQPKSKELETLATRLNRFDQVVHDSQALHAQESAFRENEFFLLCFLTNDKSERYKSAKIAMHKSGASGSKDDAKAWLAAQEKLLREQLSVDAIEIR